MEQGREGMCVRPGVSVAVQRDGFAHSVLDHIPVPVPHAPPGSCSRSPAPQMSITS